MFTGCKKFNREGKRIKPASLLGSLKNINEKITTQIVGKFNKVLGQVHGKGSK